MIDVTSEINAVERKVGSRTLSAGEARIVTIARTYATSIDDLWDACTKAERIPRWFLPISGDLRVGGRYQLEGNAAGSIEACNPPHSLSATWEFGGDISWIELRLTAESDNRTRLELEHIAHVDDARWLEFGPGAAGAGWDGAALGLSLYIHTGRGLDPREAMAWMMSAEGKQFLTLSSLRWRDASITAGTDPDQAEAAANRTTAFYTATPEPTPSA